MPRLRRILALAVAPVLRFHVDIVAVDQRHLIVRQQIAIVEVLLFGDERVIDDVGEERPAAG